LEVYRVLQRQMIGGDNREAKTKTLALLQFLTDHVDDEGRLPAWRLLRQEWNALHPEWGYGAGEQHVRNFARDCRNAEKAIAFPSYQPWSGATQPVNRSAQD
jgi:hypothetical protein